MDVPGEGRKVLITPFGDLGDGTFLDPMGLQRLTIPIHADHAAVCPWREGGVANEHGDGEHFVPIADLKLDRFSLAFGMYTDYTTKIEARAHTLYLVDERPASESQHAHREMIAPLEHDREAAGEDQLVFTQVNGLEDILSTTEASLKSKRKEKEDDKRRSVGS